MLMGEYFPLRRRLFSSGLKWSLLLPRVPFVTSEKCCNQSRWWWSNKMPPHKHAIIPHGKHSPISVNFAWLCCTAAGGGGGRGSVSPPLLGLETAKRAASGLLKSLLHKCSVTFKMPGNTTITTVTGQPVFIQFGSWT